MKKNKIATLLLIMVVAFTALTTTSCKKDQDPTPEAKEITVNVTTEGLHIQNLKSFDLNTWQYNYNPNAYELKFTGSKGNVYTYQKKIAELQAGFSVSIIPDTYTITYVSQHSIAGMIDDKLDIKINETKSITTSSDCQLNAVNDDMLIVLDNNPSTANIYFAGYGDMQFFTIEGQTYLYAYYDTEGNVNITYNSTHDMTIQNAKKGYVYHIVSTINGNTNIDILPFTETLIGW